MISFLKLLGIPTLNISSNKIMPFFFQAYFNIVNSFRHFTESLFTQIFSLKFQILYLIGGFLLRQNQSCNLSQFFLKLGCNASICDQAVRIEITSKNIKKGPKNVNFCHIFEDFFISGAWLQLQTIGLNFAKFLGNFKTIHSFKSVLIVKWEFFKGNGSGCI